MSEVTENHIAKCLDQLRISYLEPEHLEVNPKLIATLAKNYGVNIQKPIAGLVNYISTYGGIKIFVDSNLKPNQFNVFSSSGFNGGMVVEYYQILDDGRMMVFLTKEQRDRFRNSKFRMIRMGE